MKRIERIIDEIKLAWHRRNYYTTIGRGGRVRWHRRKPPILWTLFHVWLVWRRMPEQRLGQLIENAMLPYDLINTHDEDLVLALQAFAAEHKR